MPRDCEAFTKASLRFRSRAGDSFRRGSDGAMELRPLEAFEEQSSLAMAAAEEAARAAQDADRLELAALEARDGGHGSTQNAAQEAEAAAQQARAIARDAEQARAASARPPRTTERERMWAGGGPGVYSGETSREYVGQLRCDDFATDIQPEIMDGKNVPRQRLFSRFPNFNFASMASPRCHTAVTPSTWPSESLCIA